MSYTQGTWTSSEITTEQGRKMSGGYKFGVWSNTQDNNSFKAESLAFVKKVEDSHLIAAAPDMYEACRHALIALDNIDRQTGGLTQQEELLKLEIENALAKVEGR